MITTAPLLEEVGIKYGVVHYNGSFLEETIYRQRASPEVDDAWDALGVNCTICHPHLYLAGNTDARFHTARAGVISREEGLKSGLTDAHVQRADKYGGGFFVNVEGMHHLHCLVRLYLAYLNRGNLVNLKRLILPQNLVRQGLYYNYDYYKKMGTGAFVNDDMIVEKHICTFPVTQRPISSTEFRSQPIAWTRSARL